VNYTGERAIPWVPEVGRIMDQHVARYAWALQFCRGAEVVDLGCGAGYGTYMLSWVAAKAVGVDVNQGTIDYARERFWAENLYYHIQDLERGPLPAADVFLAFEVLEHLENPRGLMSKLDVCVLWSLPIYNNSTFHKHTYNPVKAEQLGGDIWYQSATGIIVPKERAWFKPVNVLGVRG